MDPEGGTDWRYYMVEEEMTVDYLREKIRGSEDVRYEFVQHWVRSLNY